MIALGLGWVLSSLCSLATASEAWTTESLSLQVDGVSYPAKLRLPPTGKVPALIVLGGFEEAAKVLELFEPKIPVAVTSFDYPYSGPRKMTPTVVLEQFSSLYRGVRLVQPLIDALTDELKRHPRIRTDCLGMIGASFGSPFASEAAARREDLRVLILLHGVGDVARAIEHRLDQVFERKLGAWPGPIRGGLAWTLARLSHLLLGAPSPEQDMAKLRSTQRVLLIQAESDEFIPKDSREALIRGARASQAQVEIQTMPGGHLQPGARETLQMLQDRAEAWISRPEICPQLSGAV